MPNINGLEVYQLHHALAGSKPTKTVILTADATPETREKCIASGVYSVLTKPILTEQIIQLVADISGQTLTVKPAKTKGKLKAVSSKHAIATTPAMLVDVDRISHLSKLGSSPAFIGNLIQQFIEASDANIEQLATMCKSMDIAGILQNTHSLIGESANIGLEALSKQSEQLAHAAEHHAQRIQTSYSKLEATYKSTRIQLLNLLAESSYQTPN
jgi:two-component system sensor histidine kinase RpfC